MKKSLFILLFALAATLSGQAALTADWRIHMPFDDWPVAVYDTPDRVYFTTRTFQSGPDIPDRDYNSYILNYYDKKGEEVLTFNTVDGASGNAVNCVSYNPLKGYLLVVYTDQNIDFIYDDGKTYNLPSLMSTSIPGKKYVNSISFDPEHNRAYLATTFGYVALNDNKHEVAESRNYGQSLSSVARCGDNVVIVTDDIILLAPEKELRYNISEYRPLGSDTPKAKEILPMSGNDFIGLWPGKGGYTYLYTFNGNGFDRKALSSEGYVYNYQYTRDGYFIAADPNYSDINRNRTYAVHSTPPSSEANQPAAFIDNKNLWTLTGRKGLRHYTYNSDKSWTLEADYTKPNAPATYISSSMAYHPTYGMLAGSKGNENAHFQPSNPAQISALKDGFWKEYSPAYLNPGLLSGLSNLYGVSIDPLDNKYVYRAGALSGLFRFNLEDPDDVMIFGNPSNSYKNFKGFVELTPDQAAWIILCRFTAPQFDNDGRMWTAYNNQDQEQLRLYYWNAADRKATTSKSTYRPLKYFTVPDFTSMNTDVLTVLKHSQNRNIIAVGSNYNYGGVYLYNHNGTPDNTNDDRHVDIHFPHDQDGGSVQFLGVNATVEDPETGLLWILSQRGLFTVNPVTAFEDPNSVNRIKVARNDGTNLADYLLNEVNVYCMAIDGEGRKWFGTANGIVCTSRDGKTILAEFTPDNSPLPSDDVYTIAYNPDNASMMVGTDAGIVEIFPSGSGNASSSDSNGVRIYPNPVEPDFYGWVRIDNLAEGSLVKITDAQGGIVKELGPVQGGSVEWDVTGFNNRRVSTGVYYVMVSPGSAGGQSSVSKILVLN